jgi:thioester reductase-like protein
VTACVTGATGFIGAHVTTYRDEDRLSVWAELTSSP